MFGQVESVNSSSLSGLTALLGPEIKSCESVYHGDSPFDLSLWSTEHQIKHTATASLSTLCSKVTGQSL